VPSIHVDTLDDACGAARHPSRIATTTSHHGSEQNPNNRIEGREQHPNDRAEPAKAHAAEGLSPTGVVAALAALRDEVEHG